MIKIILLLIVVLIAALLAYAATEPDTFRVQRSTSICRFTRVTWAMHGPVTYMAKLMHVFLKMDRMIGNQFETGLADLKTMAEH